MDNLFHMYSFYLDTNENNSLINVNTLELGSILTYTITLSF